MEAIFLKVLNLSITASWIVLVVLALRLILRKSPKWINCLLWLMVAVRLVCPFSIESALSLIPSKETVPTEIVLSDTVPEIDSGIDIVDNAVNPVILENYASSVEKSVNPIDVVSVASIVWLSGIAVMVAYMIISYIRLKLKLRTAVLLQDNLYQSEFIKSPFVMGIIKPKIYIPYNIDAENMEQIIIHEKAHLKRHDNIIKPIAFLILSVYWFNPIIWIAFVFLCKDIELACDEKVVKYMEKEEKQAYAKTLLETSTKDFSVISCPFSFGGGSIKSRIKKVINYKKPAIWIVLVSVILCFAVVICFLTVPEENQKSDIVQVNNTETVDTNNQEQLTNTAHWTHYSRLNSSEYNIWEYEFDFEFSKAVIECTSGWFWNSVDLGFQDAGDKITLKDSKYFYWTPDDKTDNAEISIKIYDKSTSVHNSIIEINSIDKGKFSTKYIAKLIKTDGLHLSTEHMTRNNRAIISKVNPDKLLVNKIPYQKNWIENCLYMVGLDDAKIVQHETNVVYNKDKTSVFSSNVYLLAKSIENSTYKHYYLAVEILSEVIFIDLATDNCYDVKISLESTYAEYKILVEEFYNYSGSTAHSEDFKDDVKLCKERVFKVSEDTVIKIDK